MARLIFVEGPWKGIEIGLKDGEYTLGRDPRCEIAVPDHALSRQHFRISRTDGAWAAHDLHSRNGTTINGAALTRAVLHDGDRLAASRHVVVFDSRDAAADPGGTTTIVADLESTRDGLTALLALNAGMSRASDAERAVDAAARWMLERAGGARAVVYRRRGAGLVVDRAVTDRAVTDLADVKLPLAAVIEAARHGNASWIGRSARGVGIVPAGANAEVVFAIPDIGEVHRESLRVLTLGAHLCAAQLSSRFRIEMLASRLSEIAGNDETLVAGSPAMLPVLEFIERASQTDSTVLLLGESGTGKELVARALHRNGPRRDSVFVAVNCAAIPAGLLESELFGHERGAFTGAVSRRCGSFEAADGGTLLLDEVGELPPPAQAGLLRVLEERTIKRLGGAQPIPVDLRIIAATHRDLSADVTTGRFRQDLFFRLSVLVASLPPLRERPQDVEELALRFLERFRARAPRPVRGFTPEALAGLRGYAWPGNVRELRNAVERAVMLGRNETVGVSDLPPDLHGAERRDPAPVERVALPMRSAELERHNLLAALAATDGNKTRAAAMLGIDRVTLYNRLRAVGKPPRGTDR